MAGLGGFGIPFKGTTEGLEFGTGKTGETIARYLEGKADKLAYAAWVGPSPRLFDPTVRKAQSEAAQRSHARR